VTSDEGQAGGTVHVLYFAGTGRSGTTVVSNILGQLPGAFAAGELRYLWDRGVEQDHLCGCGETFSRCPLWTGVMRQLAECSDTAGDLAQVGHRLRVRLRMARLPAMLLRHAAGRPPLPPHPDDDLVARLYRAVAQESGAHVIIDTSKLPPYGLLVDRLPGVRVSIVHLVRDPRATAYSWRRTKTTRDPSAGAQMQRLQTWKSSVLWMVWNLTAAVLWRERHSRVCRLRYEDLVNDPGAHLRRLAFLAGCEPSDLPFIDRHTVRLAPTHTVAGNPNRHDTGTVRLRGDDEWRSEMGLLDRALVTVLSAPGLALFGYPLRARTSSASRVTPTAPSEVAPLSTDQRL